MGKNSFGTPALLDLLRNASASVSTVSPRAAENQIVRAAQVRRTDGRRSHGWRRAALINRRRRPSGSSVASFGLLLRCLVDVAPNLKLEIEPFSGVVQERQRAGPSGEAMPRRVQIADRRREPNPPCRLPTARRSA